MHRGARARAAIVRQARVHAVDPAARHEIAGFPRRINDIRNRRFGAAGTDRQLGLLLQIFRALLRSDAGRGPEAGDRSRHPEPLPRLSASVGRTRSVTVVTTERTIRGKAWVIDGDTIVINGVKIRLAGIDAPELDHPYGKMAKSEMMAICRGQAITARLDGALSHGRSVATCYLPDGRDVGAELVKAGLAIDWPRHSGGKYRHLEAPGARRRMWRAHNRQIGRFNY